MGQEAGADSESTGGAETLAETLPHVTRRLSGKPPTSTRATLYMSPGPLVRCHFRGRPQAPERKHAGVVGSPTGGSPFSVSPPPMREHSCRRAGGAPAHGSRAWGPVRTHGPTRGEERPHVRGPSARPQEDVELCTDCGAPGGEAPQGRTQ